MDDQYRLYPLTVTAGRPWRFVLAPVAGLLGGIDPRKHRVSISSELDYRHRATAPLERTDCGELAFTFAPRLRGEYLVGIHEAAGEWPDPPRPTFAFYVADADLAGSVPRKGDLHMHTVRSDGREEPGALLARMRGLGMDFVAITDHRVFGDGCDGAGVDPLVVPGGLRGRSRSRGVPRTDARGARVRVQAVLSGGVRSRGIAGPGRARGMRDETRED